MKTPDDLKRLLSEGRLSRRSFIKHMTAMGMAAAIPSVILTQEAKAAGMKVGGRLRQALSGGSTTDTLFGVLGGGDVHQVNVQWQLLNNLTSVGADGALEAELAESWEPAENGQKWVFKLRKGVEFHNGKSLESADVVHSLNQHRGEDSRSTGKGLFTAVTDVQSDGKETVIITLNSPNADFPYTLADYHFPIAPDGSMDAEWEQGVGTGPFSLVEWEPGVRALTRRNPNYFKDGPYFDEVETLAVADVVARQNALRTGDVDVIDKPDTKTLDLLAGAAGVRIIEVAGNTHYTFPMLMDQAPFDDYHVRQAMKYSLDRNVILDVVLNGHGYVGNDHPISKSMRYYNADLPQREFDPEKARYHLQQAGLSSLDVTLSAADIYTGGMDAAQLFQEFAKKAGINIEIERAPTDNYWSEVWNVKPFSVSYWSGRPTEDLMLSLAFSNSSSWNETHWNNETFETILVAARAELDEAKRKDMYGELQRLIYDEGGLIAPVFANNITAVSDKLEIPEQISATFAADGLKNTERWAFA